MHTNDFKTKKQLGKILAEQKILPKEKIDQAQKEAEKTGETLRQVLLRLNLIPESELLPYVAQSQGIRYEDISDYEIDPSAIKLLPIDIIKKNRIIPILKDENKVTLAISDPFNYLAFDAAKKYLSNYTLTAIVTSNENVDHLINEILSGSGAVGEIIKGIDLNAYRKKVEATKEKAEKEEITPEDVPLVKLVNQMLSDAVYKGATDIHIEPGENLIKVRFRIDGLLQDIYSTPKELHESIVSRIKVLSELDIAQKRTPQDGRFRFNIEEKQYDFRVSTFPGPFGEDVVIRVLDKSSIVIGLESIGFTSRNLHKLQDLILNPNGIILITGPTGSGKTTTLYSVLNKLNKPDRKIITIEDPIEYQLPGISQSQVNVKAEFTFASGLRSVLRHDPDIIMVGEIRDLETAEIAVRSALTGHLVLSTLHTNDAAGAPTRLIDMGVEPFLISSSVIGIVAQRLVRTICPKCKESYLPSPELLEQVQFPDYGKKALRFYKGNGCPKCRQTGFSGRTLISEIIIVTEAIKNKIFIKSSSEEIENTALKEGMTTMKKDGFQKVIDGLTTIEEVLRVA